MGHNETRIFFETGKISSMLLYPILYFAAGGAIELYVLLELNELISGVNTFSLLMLMFLVGVIIGRSWGGECFEKLQWHLKSQTMPSDDALNGALMAFAGMLFITPGVVSDAVGLLILIPNTRGLCKEAFRGLIRRRISRGETYVFFKD
jgi:UPF0716 protein FxsA